MHGGIPAPLQALHDVRVEAAQVNARDCADAAMECDRAGEPVPGDANAHAALDDRQ